MRVKVSKTEKWLLALTVLFLLVLTAFFLRDRSQTGETGTYTVTTERRAEEAVAPEDPGPVNLNTATAEELIQLKGVGEVIAQRIIDWREANGPFTSIEQIMEVKGIGEVTFNNIKDEITVEDTA